jgi:cysteine synthase A
VDILHAIGNTSMVRLRKVVPPNCADIFVKLEWENPTGSMKDRMALAVISRAEEDGRLRPGDTVVEYTTPTGSTSSTTRTASRAATRSARRSGVKRRGRSTPSFTPRARRLPRVG